MQLGNFAKNINPRIRAMIRQTCNGGVRIIRRPNLPR